MALSDTEKAYLVEILGIPHPELVAAELAEVLPEQEVILQSDLARYQVIRGEYGSLNGRTGIVFHPGDERAAIRKRCIKLLNCAETVNAYAANNNFGRILRA